MLLPLEVRPLWMGGGLASGANDSRSVNLSSASRKFRSNPSGRKCENVPLACLWSDVARENGL